MRKSIFSLGAAVAATALGMSGAANAEGVNGPTITGTRLDITARGEVSRVPDIAVISAGVVTQSQDAKSALADNAAKMSRVLAALRKAGIAERDIATSSISLNPQYRYAENTPPTIIGYQASNTVTVRFRDIGRSGAILDTLVGVGANQINGPSLEVDKPEEALDQARLHAIADAKRRAQIYAAALGTTVKRVVTLSESTDSPGPRPYMMAMARADAAPKTEIAPGEQQVSVTVQVVFELN